MDLQPHINEVLLHEVIKYELTQVNNLKDMLQQRDLMIKSHEKTVRCLYTMYYGGTRVVGIYA